MFSFVINSIVLVGKLILSLVAGTVSLGVALNFLGQLILVRNKIRLTDGRFMEGPDKQLGGGSFGKVYQYTLEHNQTKTSVAVKVPSEQEFNAMQKHELDILKKASNHPNIIGFIGSAEFDRKIFIVMELMNGTVQDLLNENPRLSWQTKLSIAQQMMKGLTHLHNLKLAIFLRDAIIHQDLKTANLLVDRRGDDPQVKVKIADFGIAREVEQLNIPVVGELFSKLHKGKAGGTLIYTAPEIVKAMATGKEGGLLKSDVFSAGMILWEIATGAAPFRTGTEILSGTFNSFQSDKNSRQRLVKTSIFGTTKYKPTYPKSSLFGEVIDKCIKPDPNERESAEETLEALQRIKLS